MKIETEYNPENKRSPFIFQSEMKGHELCLFSEEAYKIITAYEEHINNMIRIAQQNGERVTKSKLTLTIETETVK